MKSNVYACWPLPIGLDPSQCKRSLPVSAQDFGANDWLVDEMYEHYLADPSSVDPAWIEYFKTNKPASAVGSAAGLNTSANKNTPPTPPIPKAAQRAPQVAAPQVLVPQAPAAQVSQPVATPQSTQPVVRENALTPATPADPIVKPVPVLITPSASTLEPIRGVGARVVQSMEASLSVPTATSVRAVPAKLMIDNRIVLNLSLIHI